MFYLYLTCLIIGGVFLGLSIFGSGHDSDAGDISDTDLAADDFSLEHGDMDIPWYMGKYFPLLSMRFWVFFAFFFGLSGIAVSIFKIEELTGFIWAVSMGIITGYLAFYVFKKLRESESSSFVEKQDFIGQTVKVVLPISPGKTGKITCTIKGQTIEQLAISDDKPGFNIGDSGTIIGFEGVKAQITKKLL